MTEHRQAAAHFLLPLQTHRCPAQHPAWHVKSAALSPAAATPSPSTSTNLFQNLQPRSRVATRQWRMDYAQEQADEIEALESIYTGYFDKLSEAPPYKV